MLLFLLLLGIRTWWGIYCFVKYEKKNSLYRQLGKEVLFTRDLIDFADESLLQMIQEHVFWIDYEQKLVIQPILWPKHKVIS